MNETNALTVVDSQHVSIPASDARPGFSLEAAILQWLDIKQKRTGSNRTQDNYRDTLWAFRANLQRAGLDLDSFATQADKDKVKLIAQLYAGYSTKPGKSVKPATINNRLAILSSFYAFCHRQEWLEYNPIDHLERSKVEAYTDVKALAFEDIAAMFDSFDLNKLSDLRDCALLAIALQTGRRVSELAGLRWQHVTIKRGIVTLFFARCKGNKSTSDELDDLASMMLIRWLERFYGKQLKKLDPDTPLWVSLDEKGCNPKTKEPTYGQALSIQAIGQISKKWTGTAHVHRLRNTFAMGMLETGASLREVGGRLLHSSLATTSGYVDKLQSAKNNRAADLSKLFNFK